MQHVLPVLALIKRNTFSLAYNLIFINHNVRSRNFSVYGKNQLISPITSASVVFSAVCKNIFVKYYYVSSSISCTHVSSKDNKYALFSETVKLEGSFLEMNSQYKTSNIFWRWSNAQKKVMFYIIQNNLFQYCIYITLMKCRIFFLILLSRF